MNQQTTHDSPGASPGEQTALGTDRFAPIERLGVLRVWGADAAEFLQGQFTSDVRQVSHSHHQLSSWCNPKGRVLACFRICLIDGVFHLLVRRDLLPLLEKRLGLFVLRSAVSIEDASEALDCIGIAGANVEEVLCRLGAEPPTEIDGAATAAGITLLRIPGPVPRFLALGPTPELKKLNDGLAPLVGQGDEAWWTLLDIEAGLPVIGPETTEAFLPQMLNLQALGGISFRKGCYPGQEVVARLHYRGQLKRRLYRCRTQGPDTPAAGAPLFAPGETPEQSAGSVLAASPRPDGGIALIAVVQIDAAGGGTLRLGSPEGAAVELLGLPYSLDTP